LFFFYAKRSSFLTSVHAYETIVKLSKPNLECRT